jgi:hypothetical protein
MKYLRKVAVLAALLLFAQGAFAQAWSAATAFSSTGSSQTVGSAIPVTGATSCIVSLVSASSSSAVFSLEGSIDGATYWKPLATETNPTSVGDIWAGPCAGAVRFNPSTHASGDLKGYVRWRSMIADPLASSWKRLTASANTFGALAVTSLTNSGLTDTYVPYATTGGLHTGSSTFKYTTSGGILDVTAIRPSGLTAGRIPFAGVNGLLGDIASFTYNSTTGAMIATAGTAPSFSTARFLSTGTAPTVANVGASSCGTDAATIVGKDQAFVVTVGATSGTECRVSFNVAFASAPICTFTGSVATDLHATSTTTYVTVTGTLTAAEKLYGHCLGY